MKNYGIILASGVGNRYRGDIPKQFVKLAGKTILEHTIEVFEKSNLIDEIIVVITPEYRHFAEDILLKNNFKKISKLVKGGATRKESSCIGINVIKENEANVIIHDCARPFLTEKIIRDCVKALEKYNAVDVAIPTTDTIIEINEKKLIENIPDRSKLQRGQTPQCFKLSLIKKAHELSMGDSNYTDDCGLILKYKLGQIYTVEGDIENIKITYPSDIYIADRLFQIRNTIYSEQQNLSDLRNKVIVIFGGTSGIGLCTAELAKANGANVFVTSSRIGCDITNYSLVEKYLKEVNYKVGKIDYVVNSVGTLKMGKLIERKLEDIQQDINVNFMGTINVIKASIPYLKVSHGSLQLYTSSSYTRGRALYSIYSSTKASIVNLVQAISEEVANDKIRVNAISPERCATPMRFNAFGKEAEGSLLKPEVVAEISLKVLLSNLTGQIIDVRK